MAADKKPLAQWYETLLDSVVKEREPASRSYRYLSRLIEREYPRTDSGVVLGFSCANDDQLSTNVLLMQAYCLQSELGGSVLLIDARVKNDGGGISQRLGLDHQTGYAELMREGPAEMAALIQATTVPNVSVLPQGGQAGKPLVVHRQHLTTLLEQARAGYNYVLLQLGSVTADTRNLVSATHADAMLLLAHENKTLMRELLAAEQLLRGNGVDDVRVIVAAGES
ncbi:MAG: hypothetical protein E6Q94_03565 [Burkholderiaceae bacterium]|jgi:Mrp family chromosome partitioning ATPase|uniref:hypothetical protein n=1 Tax=Ottowia thiooxydans TaxID=219182 RepID=UPI000427A7D6|nr:hypothetical protein [Ottowia thiooxydans]TXH35875.1 MAG: hypothetical protein E6Q94_03565 [Burkholderiaceae bacterium]